MNWPTWEELLLRILPLEVYEDISYDMAEIFSAAAHQIPPAKEAFSSMSLPQLQEFANNHAISARNYDPHESVHEVQQFFARLYKLIETLLVAIIVIGSLAGLGLWVTYSRNLLEAFGVISQLLISVLLSAPVILALPAGLVLLYVRLLSFNTFVVQVLNRTLVIGPSKTNTREEATLVGYGLWNSSLDGGFGLKLLSVFSALWLLSALIPRRDPYAFVKQAVAENIDAFQDADGFIDATKRAYHRIRCRDGQASGEVPGGEETPRDVFRRP